MEKDNENYQLLLEDYRSIWNNRLLTTKDQTSKETLNEAIKRELLDENSHPRIRKDKYEKYYSAVKRIMTSQISLDSKVKLVEIHIAVIEEIS